MTFAVPDSSRVWGIDISGRWDGNVDFTATKRAGASFVVIKCVDGTVPTRLWKENRIRAFTAGLIVGEYAWLYRDVNVPCREQARAAWELIKNEPKQIPLAIDFEWTKYMGVPANPNYSDLDKWVTEFTRLSGYKPGFYSAAGYMNDYGAMPLSLRNKFSYFWVANYGVRQPSMPRGFDSQDWQFWQFAATGEAAVIAPNDTGKRETDLNYWNGDLASLRDFVGLGVTQPPEEIMTTRYEAVSAFSMSLRPDHSTSNTPILPSIAAQSRIHGDELWNPTVSEKWLRVSDVGGVARSGWVAIVTAGRIYCTLTDNGAPPVEADPDYVVLHYADGRTLKYIPE
jgi:lysozyme